MTTEPFLTRGEATGWLREQGVPAAHSTLQELAYDGRGPEYTLINGRCLYRVSWLRKWVEDCAARASSKTARARSVGMSA
jgi:hypothetical protein